MAPAGRKRRAANLRTLEGVLKAVKRLQGRGATFNALLSDLRSRGVLSNHRSLRAYLDLLVATGCAKMRREPGGSPNVRARQVYRATGEGPYVKVGDGALIFHGVNWETPTDSVRDAEVSLEGAARGTLDSGVAYASLEDTAVEELKRSGGDDPLAATYCAALLAPGGFDEGYLLRRARREGVGRGARELLSELKAVLAGPRVPVRDVKTLYAVRRARPPPRWGGTLPAPRWDLFSPDALLDVVGKQLGVK